MKALLIYKPVTRRHPRFCHTRAHTHCPYDGSLAKAKWRNHHVGLKRGKKGRRVGDKSLTHADFSSAIGRENVSLSRKKRGEYVHYGALIKIQ